MAQKRGWIAYAKARAEELENDQSGLFKGIVKEVRERLSQMKGQEMDLQTKIRAQNDQRLYVDQYDDGVWMSLHHQHGSSNVVLDKEQAKDLIAALIRIVDGDTQ